MEEGAAVADHEDGEPLVDEAAEEEEHVDAPMIPKECAHSRTLCTFGCDGKPLCRSHGGRYPGRALRRLNGACCRSAIMCAVPIRSDCAASGACSEFARAGCGLFVSETTLDKPRKMQPSEHASHQKSMALAVALRAVSVASAGLRGSRDVLALRPQQRDPAHRLPRSPDARARSPP